MMKKATLEETTHGRRSLAKGLLAGLIGGLVATAAKSVAEKLYPPRTHGEPEPPEVLEGKIAGHELTVRRKTAAAGSFHWGFGALAGAAYGGVVEYFPEATEEEGAAFGMALGSLTHGKERPAVDLSAKPEEQTVRERTSEIASHVMFGMVTETVRRMVRGKLG
jgi:putative membrane protein